MNTNDGPAAGGLVCRIATCKIIILGKKLT